jgi:hypothetical protein
MPVDPLFLTVAAVAAVLPIILFAYYAAGVRIRARFSVTALLIAMALAAAVLGFIAALSR